MVLTVSKNAMEKSPWTVQIEKDKNSSEIATMAFIKIRYFDKTWKTVNQLMIMFE